MGIMGSWEGYVSSPLYLFNGGTWSNLQTTGISVVYNNTAFESITCIETSPIGTTKDIGIFGSSSRSSTNTSGSAFSRLNQAVNLSSYSAVTVPSMHYYAQDGSATFYFGVSTNANLTSHNYSASVSRSVGVNAIVDEIKTIDVSNLSGNYYIYFSFNFTKQFSAASVSTRCQEYAKELYLIS